MGGKLRACGEGALWTNNNGNDSPATKRPAEWLIEIRNQEEQAGVDRPK
jgi:hypothetical protein